MNDFSADIESLSPEKRELLELLLQEPGSHDVTFLLSFAQQRLWFLEQFAPGSPQYNLPAAVQITGDLNPAILAESVNGCVQRHEVLRTTFGLVGSEPVQRIASSLTIAMPLIDLRALPDREGCAQALLTAEARQPFDLARGPLLRTTLLQLADQDYILLLTLHHIVSDGWSINIFVHELLVFYEARLAGRVPLLPELPIQYGDFAQWQREQLQGPAFDRELAYWKQQLSGELPILDLATRPRPRVQSANGAVESFWLPPALADTLIELSRRENATPFMLLLAAFDVLLYRYSGQTDIIVGTPIAGRTQEEIESLIGFFVNTLVLRADLARNPSFRMLLAQVRRVTLESYNHQDVPFEQVVEALQPERNLSYTALFQIMFMFHSTPLQPIQLPNMRIRHLPIDSGTAKFDLTLSLMKTERGLKGSLEYNRDLFESPMIVRMLGHFHTLLDAIVADPDRGLNELPLLTTAERQQLLGWNSTPIGYSQDQCLHECFAAQVERTPDAIAVVFDLRDKEIGRQGDTETKGRTKNDDSVFSLQPSAFSLQLTYRELDRRANQLAQYLRTLGIGPDVVVGLCLQPTLDLVIGILGVLKAGAAYLPLDPAYPAERLRFMLEDSQVAVLLTATEHADTETRRQGDKEITQRPGSVSPSLLVSRTVADTETRSQGDKEITQRPGSLSPSLFISRAVVDLRADWPQIARMRTDTPPRRAHADNLAYVIYTSGSTGRPKGTLISHANVSRLFAATQPWVQFGPSDVLTLFHSYAFDFAVWELWGALVYGGRLLLVPQALRQAPEPFYQLLVDERVTLLNQTPTAFSQLALVAQQAPATPALRLRLVIFGGEALEPAQLRSWLARYGEQSPQLVNMYGITEATVHVTYQRVGWADLSADPPLRIGQPIAAAQVYVVDVAGQLAPIGVAGELYIGGGGLARGYLRRPDLTAERFVPNPFAALTPAAAAAPPLPRTGEGAGGEGSRLYRTGDRGRWLADGTLEYLGRLDGQVKLRGYRIELAEVARVLEQHAAVLACVVLLRTNSSSASAHLERRLVAYVVPAETLNAECRTMNGPEWSSSAFSVQRSALAADLRAFLAERLPEHMVPTAFVLLERLPLTANGKLDRRALPDPDPTRPALAEPFIAPRTPAEELLAQIWAALLPVARVGVHDNFFGLGGHSLLATQVVTRVRSAFGVALAVRALFEAPTVAELATRIAALQQDAPGPQEPPLRPVARTGALPLAFAQQRLWFLDQLEPNSPAYNLPIALQLTGNLDLAALRNSLNALVRRHEVLRTSFPASEGQPMQRIASPQAVPLPLLDLRMFAPTEREATAHRLATAEARRPFDLMRGPLLRVTLLRLDTSDHVLLFTMHHIVSDGWSMGVLVSDCIALYRTTAAGQPSALPALPIQYVDYAVWQREWLQGALLAEQLSYWRRQLADLRALDLPTDYPRPPLQRFQGAHHSIALPGELSAGLAALGRQVDTTLFMTLLAAFQTLLARYTRQTDIAVGTPIAGRSQHETERLIGCFVNTLVIRSALHWDQPFQELLGRVRETALDAYAHQHAPFEQVVEALQSARDMSRPALIQVLFVLQNVPIVPLELPDLRAHVLAVESGTTKFDLSLVLTETEAGLVGTLEYRTDLFAASTIARLAGHFQVLLAACVAQPATPLAALPLLTVAERQQLLHDWSGSATGVRSQESGVRSVQSGACCIHQLFEVQAARTPDAIAVVFEDQRLSYAELNAHANQLAAHLRALGVGPDVRVGICLERSLALMIGIFGVLKAGAAYLPIDPALPAERKAFLLEDSQAAALITDSIYDLRLTIDDLEAFPAPIVNLQAIDDLEASPAPIVNRKSKIVNLHGDWPHIACASRANPISAVHPDHLVYTIYTSGSTGTPKGVAIAHRQLLNYVCAVLARLELPPDASYATVSTIAADLGNTAIFPALCSGGCLHIISQERVVDAAMLAGYFRRNPADCLKIVPSHLAALLASVDARDILPRQCLVLGGEATSWELIERIVRLAPDCRIVNHYGPTETTVGVMAYELGREGLELRAGPVPLGAPLANSQIYLLDRLVQPVPIGVAGEVYIGGAGLARGYLGRPDLTAERFVPNPFAEVSGIGYRVLGAEPSDTRYPTSDTRLYKTGDLARYRPDGSIEFLGRLDGQIKLRGYRIELAEVARVLERHAAVQACVVRASEDVPGDQRLVAYVVAAPDRTDTIYRVPTTDDQGNPSIVHRPSSIVTDLRVFLQAQLPDYMIPAAFVFLDAFPLTANGKLDLAALPAPDGQRREMAAGYVAPRTPIEELLVDIWADILRVAQVGVEDNFFALGGHSLLATQVISRIRGTFQVELPLRTLFETPTVTRLAEAITDARRDGTGRLAPPLRPAARQGELPLSFAQQRLWFLDQLASGSLAYHMSSAVYLTGPLDVAALQRSLNAIVRRHEVLRTSFVIVDGHPAQIVALAQTIPLPLLDLQALPSATREALVRRLAEADARHPFDLARGPLLHATLLRLDDQTHVLLATMHHIVSDGWSRAVLIRELAAFYTAYAAGQPAMLPELPIQYADFAIWQRAWLQADVLETQLAYWRRQLADAPILDLPTDYPRPPITTFVGVQHNVALPQPLHSALMALIRREGVTMFMTLVAAFQTLLARYSGQSDIVIGTPIAGRTRAETEGLIGFFVNTLILRADLSGNPSFRELLRRVRAICLDAYAYQDLPFEQLVEALAPVRDLSRQPLFSVIFGLQNAPMAALELPSLTWRPLVAEATTARFDLGLALAETSSGLVGTLEYRTDLFAAATTARMMRHFATLLDGIVADPDQRLAALPLLTAAEQRQLLVEWNDTRTSDQRAPDDFVCVHQLFDAQVARTPDAVALVCEERQLTYQALAARANQLAHYLQRIGVGPEVRVGLCLERSPELVIGLLAILKAGGAYLPLDPTYPAERLAFMLHDAQVPVLIVTKDDGRWTMDDLGAADTLIVNRTSKIVNLCTDWSQVTQMRTDTPPSRVSIDNLAYLIYTSGTTGRPKAVMVEHRNVVNTFQASQYIYRFGPHDRVPCLLSFSFDITLFECLTPLLAGGVSILVPQQYVLDRSRWITLLSEITLLHAPPGLLRQIVGFAQTAGNGRSDQLRRIAVGGDVIPPALLHEVQQSFPAAQLYIGYGPTEGTIMCTNYAVLPAKPPSSHVIGRPMQNMQVRIYDLHQRLVPVGVPGELYIGGAGVVRGYLNRPDMTAEKFIPNPFADCRLQIADCRLGRADPIQNPKSKIQNGERLYKTGDLARYLHDGTIEFLGRIDHQVKVRGYRVELGEIEAILGSHPSIRESVVVARADMLGEKQLVAYVVPTVDVGRAMKDERPDSSIVHRPSSIVQELRVFLQERLPSYMVPAVFVLLEALPLTQHGKVDRHRLPAPDAARRDQEPTFVAPRTMVEKRLARLWSELLGIEQLGIHANFFELGGHSLLATQLVSHLRKAFQLELPLRSLFEAPTIVQLAEIIEEQLIARLAALSEEDASKLL